MRKLVLGIFLIVVSVGMSASASAKSIVYNGIECATPNNTNWVPSTPGMYGFAGGVAYCPIVQQASEGYSYSKLGYVILYGINLMNPRLCQRSTGNGAVTCGTSALLGGDTWILYSPGGGTDYDDAFLSINVGSGVSLIKRYAVAWSG
jgi:hypothetical protein